MKLPDPSTPPGGSLWRRLAIIAATTLVAALCAYVIVRAWPVPPHTPIAAQH